MNRRVLAAHLRALAGDASAEHDIHLSALRSGDVDLSEWDATQRRMSSLAFAAADLVSEAQYLNRDAR
jgi:hypothetical protein